MALCFHAWLQGFVRKYSSIHIRYQPHWNIQLCSDSKHFYVQSPFYFVHLLFGWWRQWVDSAWVLDPQGTPPYAVWTSVWSSWAWEGERSSCTARVLEALQPPKCQCSCHAARQLRFSAGALIQPVGQVVTMAPSGVPSDVLRNGAARTRVDCSFVICLRILRILVL